MTVTVNTTQSLSYGLDFDIGFNSLDGTIIMDLDLNSLAAGSHCGLVFNRYGIRLGTAGLGGPVSQANQIRLWEEGAGPIFNSDGKVYLEQWFRRVSGEPEFMSMYAGTIGANKLVRVTHATSGTFREFTVNSVSSLGGSIGSVLIPTVKYESGANSEMRTGMFSPFVLAGGLTFRCIRKD